jgi:hypothetical protein
MESTYLPLQHVLASLERKYSVEKQRSMPAHYNEDLMRSMRAVCKMIRFDLETLTLRDSYARQISRCLYSELDLLSDSADITRLATEFTKRYMMAEEGREELRRMIQGHYACEPDSDDEEECWSDCDTDCDESTEASERSGIHRLRMTIRELLGSRRTEVVYKKVSKKRSH